MPKSYINIYIYIYTHTHTHTHTHAHTHTHTHTHTGVPETFDSFKEENFVVNPVSNSAISLCASSTEFTYPKLSACLPSSNGSRLKILAMLFLFVPQESWDLQLRMFGYISCGFPRIFGYVFQVIKYSISVPLDRGGLGGWNLMLTQFFFL